MSLLSGSRSLQNVKGDDNSRQALSGLSPPVAVSLPPLDSVEDNIDAILPRRDEGNAESGSIVDIALAISGQTTTLRTTVRATSGQRASNTQRSLLPTMTGRPSQGPTGFQTVRPPVGPAGSQSVRPSLQPSVPPLQVPVTSSSRSSPIPATMGSVSTTSGLVPILSVPAATATSANALPEEATGQPSITATPSSGVDAGSVVGYILLALVGVAALVGGFFFIKKKLSKRNDQSKRLIISSPSSSDPPSANEPPMVMARSYPDIAARLGTIAARAEQGETGLMVSQPPPPPPFRNNRVDRETPFVVNNRSADPESDEVPLVLAQSYPRIAAELGAIAARAQRGETGATAVQQPQASQNDSERRGFPFAEPPPGRYYTERMSGDEGLESPVAPEFSNEKRWPRNVR